MNVIFIQQWNVRRESEDDYVAFIIDTYIPTLNSMGLKVVGGYYVEIGASPNTVAVLSANNMDKVNEVVFSDAYRKLTNELSSFVTDRTSALGFSTGRISDEPYTIQEGVWKWNHYYNVRANQKENYKTTLAQLVEVFKRIDFVEVTQEWHMLYGGRADYLLEMTFKDPIDVARLMNNPQFRKLERMIKKELISNYSSRLLRSTERFDKPRWITL